MTRNDIEAKCKHHWEVCVKGQETLYQTPLGGLRISPDAASGGYPYAQWCPDPVSYESIDEQIEAARQKAIAEVNQRFGR